MYELYPSILPYCKIATSLGEEGYYNQKIPQIAEKYCKSLALVV